MSNNEQNAKNPPVAKIRVGVVTASIFANTSETGTHYAATLPRGYRDSEGKWHSSTSYNADELLALGKAAHLAHTKILELQEAGH